MALPAGATAPDFALLTKTADGLKEVRLSDLRGQGPVVLLFFPLAFTSVCTAEMCAVRDGLQAYQSLQAAVLGISVDSPFTLEVFAQKERLNFPLLSDFNRQAALAYDVLYGNFLPGKLGFAGVAKRAAFVIGRDGVIRFSWSSDNPADLPDFGAVQRALAS